MTRIAEICKNCPKVAKNVSALGHLVSFIKLPKSQAPLTLKIILFGQKGDTNLSIKLPELCKIAESGLTEYNQELHFNSESIAILKLT